MILTVVGVFIAFIRQQLLHNTWIKQPTRFLLYNYVSHITSL